MSALSLYYLVRSVDECIHSADAHRTPSNELVVCGLTEGPVNLVNVLSAVTSAAMRRTSSSALAFCAWAGVRQANSKQTETTKRNISLTLIGRSSDARSVPAGLHDGGAALEIKVAAEGIFIEAR